jgi:nuclear transport factor 2 (NTF2) superfamily protein
MFAGAYAFAVWRELIPCGGWHYAYEWHDDSGNWFRSYGNENWEFAENGLMQNRFASINDLPIVEADRKFHWPQGRRPDDHPGIFELGLLTRERQWVELRLGIGRLMNAQPSAPPAKN